MVTLEWHGSTCLDWNLELILLFNTLDQFNKIVKACRTDNGVEFVNKMCREIFKELCIMHQKPALATLKK